MLHIRKMHEGARCMFETITSEWSNIQMIANDLLPFPNAACRRPSLIARSNNKFNKIDNWKFEQPQIEQLHQKQVLQ